MIVLDDLGFAHLGCYGSDLLTPNIDRLRRAWVALHQLPHDRGVLADACVPADGAQSSPRRDGHAARHADELPGVLRSRCRASAGTLAQILRAEGYATFCVGKWHLVRAIERVTGPYDMWPTGLGFDRYYGFLNGETNQWTPNLVRDTNHVEPPREPDDGYHLDADLADNAIAYLRELRISHPRPAVPALVRVGGAARAPPGTAGMDRTVPRSVRRRLGRVARPRRSPARSSSASSPRAPQLSERPPWIEEWSTIDAPRRALYARMMEVFAAFIAHADHHIGRVLDHLESTGDLDNTVVVFVSDNGTSGEGGPNGTYNQLGHYISDEPDDIADELAHIDDLGGFRSSGHYPWGWALAGNTPFRRWKRYTFEGGVRDPFILAGPGRRRRRRRPRSVLPRHRRAPDGARALRRRAARRRSTASSR